MSYSKYHLIVSNDMEGYWTGNVGDDLIDIMSPHYFTGYRMECNICGTYLSTLIIIGSKDPYATLYAIGRARYGKIYIDSQSFKDLSKILNEDQMYELEQEITIL